MALAGKHKWIAIAAGLAGAVLMIAFFLYLPTYIETRLIPRWAADAGLEPGTVRIRRVALNGADAGPIHIDLGSAASLEIAAVQIDYSLRSLIRCKIDAIVVSGLSLELTLDEEGSAVIGWERPSRRQESYVMPELKSMLPIELEQAGLRNAAVTVHWKKHTFRAQVDADLDTGDLRQGRLRGSLQLTVRGHQLDITAALDDRTNRVDLRLEGRQLALDHFSDLIAAFARADASGRLDLTAEARGTLRPAALASLTATARMRHLRIDTGGTLLENAAGADGTEHPLIITLDARNGQNWRWSAAPLQCSRPVKLTIDRLDGDLALNKAGWRATAAVRSSVLPQPLTLPGQPMVHLDRPLTLHWTIAANRAEDSAVVFEARAEEAGQSADHPLGVSMAETLFKGRAPYLKLSGRLSSGQAQASFDAGMTGIEALHPQGSARSPKLTLTGEIHAGGDNRIDVVLDLGDTQVELGDSTAGLPKTQLKARLARGDRNEWRLTGGLGLSGGRIRSPADGIGVDELAIRLPLQWPVPENGPAGTLNAGAIRWNSKNIGTLKGRVALRPGGLHMDLDHVSKLFTGLNVHIQAAVGTSETTLSLSVPPWAPSVPVDLAQFFPAAAGVTVGGRIEATGLITLSGATILGGGRIHLEQGLVRQSQRQLAIEGIACDLLIDDLTNLRSAAGQRLSVDRLTMGKITANDMAIDFQLEPDRTLFIEKAVLAWCGGTVQTAAVRLKPGLSDVAATLHCDRLNLAMLLEQLGAARGSGEGSVNGGIPLRWQRGRLSFDNGFLYSTPGRTGTIQLQDTQFLLAGLPPGSPQHIQMDIATEALKDYSYNWAVLTLQSQAERLLVSLQLDGKPNRLLPFAYHPQTGRFERIEGQGQAEFKGIGLTLNFNTPLNEILHYKDFIKGH
ncbi:MAG: hypothetical protein C4519_12480 [Desulfobacteraceae bacterium]|nr:MAG: hypothetical protein C4519_12480 [Desulfobacteraceae bacterium]